MFDLDGTLVDSDRALIEPYLRLGFTVDDIQLGRLLVDECARLGISMDDYLAHYDSTDVAVFPGVEDVLTRLPRWAVASNKIRASGEAEIARFGWKPACALFAEDFGGRSKHLEPVLDRLGVSASDVLFVGDTAHDRVCARDAGAAFALAGWNLRVLAGAGDLVLSRPADVLDHLDLTG
ncbi:MAG TPA: HAD hydrolase-like protein [Acidimicrobiia bacterium]|nr:HAD hydrolase-like protein [Acidimicrobiia bacterium]